MSFNSLTLQKDWFLELTNQSMAIIFAILVISMLIYSRTFTFQSTHQEYSKPDTSNDSYSSYRIQKGFSNTPFTGQNISTTQKFVFCNQCIANQNIVLNLLQNSEEESMEYKRSLEERYPPVCMDCEPNVSKTIHSINTSLFTSSPTKPPRKQVFTNADKFDDMPNQTESFQHTKNLQLSLERTNIHPIFKRTANITAGIGIAFLICLISSYH
ncbi:hypothetical protein BC833DRAFT_269430 [Globomyces pollinis-pini]|nr:hypothetical protein BC833DRAFT_269430 [Globomyces pollinis-pini]